jgi:hypothetical protein
LVALTAGRNDMSLRPCAVLQFVVLFDGQQRVHGTAWTRWRKLCGELDTALTSNRDS